MLFALRNKGQKKSSGMFGTLTGSYATLVSRLVLGGVFLVAGVTKALNPGELAASIRTYELGLPEWFVTLSAYALPYLEVLIGFYLLIGLFTRFSAWTTNVMMAVFLVALVQGALRGLQIDCGCFGTAAGSGEPASLWLDVARDVGLLALGLHIALSPLGRFSVDALLRRARPNSGTSET